MFHRTLLVGCLLCLLWARAAQPDPAPRLKSALDEVTGLQRPVTLAEPKIALGELLQKVAKETGVPVYADRTTADEPAAVVVTDMPAARLLNELADFFDYRWARESGSSGPRFRLYQDLKQKAEEEAQRRAAWADEQRRLQEVLAAYIRVGQLSDEEYAVQREALEQRPAGAPRPSYVEDRFFRGLRECGDGSKRALARLLGRLTAADWEALWQGQRLRLYSKPEPGERGLPPDIAGALTSFRPSASWDVQRRLARAQEPEVADALRRNYERQDRTWAAAEGVRVVIRLQRPSDMGRLFSRDRAATSLTASLVPLVNNPPADGVLRLPPQQVRVWIWATNTQPKWGYDPPERLAELEKDPVFNTPQPFSPKATPVADPRRGLIYGRIPDLLPEIARAYKVSFLADAYSPTPVVPASSLAAPVGAAAPAVSLGALLTRLSGHYESDINRITFNYYRWDRKEKLVRLRDRLWFFDRPKEIPMRLTARWERMFAEQGCLPLEEYAAGIASLTDEQWDNLAVNARLGPLGFEDIPTRETDRGVLRLYRTLTPAQRTRLVRGAPIPWLEMNAVQRDLFLTIVEDQSGESIVPATRADLAGATLTLYAEPMDLIRRKQGSSVRHHAVERGTDASRYPTLFGDGPEAGPAAEQAAPGGEAPPVPVTYTRFPAAWVRLTVHCGRTDPAQTTLLVATRDR